MPTKVVIRKTPSAAYAAWISIRRRIEATPDPSIEGILIFSGIGLALTVLAALFQDLQLPPPCF